MIDRSKAFWAWVWNFALKPKQNIRELVIDTFGDTGGCIVADDPTAFLEGKDPYTTTWWNHHERIPEPKKRLMTREEILGFIAWNPHTVIRYNNGVANPITTLYPTTTPRLRIMLSDFLTTSTCFRTFLKGVPQSNLQKSAAVTLATVIKIVRTTTNKHVIFLIEGLLFQF